MRRSGRLALVSRRWWRCHLEEPSCWAGLYVSCSFETAEHLERQLEGRVQQAGHVGQHVCKLELYVYSQEQPEDGRAVGILARRLPQLLGCLSPDRLWPLTMQRAALADSMANAVQRLAPWLEWLVFGSTASALPAARFCQLAGHLSALEILDVKASSVAPSVLAAIAALPRLDALELESQAALPDASQLFTLTRLSRLELCQSMDAAGPLRVPSAARLTQLTRLALSAAEMQASRCVCVCVGVRWVAPADWRWQNESCGWQGAALMPCARSTPPVHLVPAVPRRRALLLSPNS